MAKKNTVEARLERLGALEDAPLTPEVEKDLAKALAGAQNAVVAKAAGIVGRRELGSLQPALVAAFDRCMVNPVKSDKGCMAKTAIAEALDGLEYWDGDLFLRGVRHVQREAAWGEPVDTADTLRAQCGLALARLGHPETLFELAALLMDPEVQPRRTAVQAFAHLEGPEAELLLRTKALAGDDEPDVMADCFAGLMGVAGDHALEFVARFLGSEQLVIAEGAALALGQSRLAGAFEVLRKRWEESIDAAFKEMLLLPMALHRSDEAFAFLLSMIGEEHGGMAAAAVEALKLFSEDERRRAQIHGAVEERDERVVTGAYEEAFGGEALD